MDDSNNLNPNDANNIQDTNINNSNNLNTDSNSNMNTDPYQNQDPYASMNADMNSNPYQNQDPFASVNADINSNPYQNQDPYASINTDINSNPYQNQDPYASLNPDMNIPMDSNPYQSQDPFTITNTDMNSNVINPILSQDLSNTNNATNFQNDNNFASQNMNNQNDNAFAGQDMNYSNDNSFAGQDMNYQNDNAFTSQDMNNQNDNIFASPNMNGQNVNNFSNQDMNNNTYDMNSNPSYGNTGNVSTGDYNMDFVKTWMGGLYDKAHSSKFNCSAAFSSIVGGVYFLYRKMHLTGLLFTILQFLLLFLSLFMFTKFGPVSLGLTAGVVVVFFLIYGFAFYPLYRNFVKSKLNKFKTATQDNSQLVNMASQKGGTSVIAVASYCICIPIIIAAILALLVNFDIINFSNSGNNSKEPSSETQDTVDTEDIILESLDFTDGYSMEYDPDTWFYSEDDKSLTKGDYKLVYSGQAISNLKGLLSVDVTTPDGRSTLLSTLVSSLESQGAQLNMSVQAGSSTFVVGTSNNNVYYSYIDVTAENAISRYYLILIPEDDILFQFVLSTNDTTIDTETNIEVIEILTSISKIEEINEENSDNDANSENQVDENSDNTIDESDTNNVTDDGNSTNETTVNGVSTQDNTVSENNGDEVSGNTTEPSDNTTNDNTTTTDNSVVVPELGEFLR